MARVFNIYLILVGAYLNVAMAEVSTARKLGKHQRKMVNSVAAPFSSPSEAPKAEDSKICYSGQENGAPRAEKGKLHWFLTC